MVVVWVGCMFVVRICCFLLVLCFVFVSGVVMLLLVCVGFEFCACVSVFVLGVRYLCFQFVVGVVFVFLVGIVCLCWFWYCGFGSQLVLGFVLWLVLVLCL